jgi:putrescine transport system permease protein
LPIVVFAKVRLGVTPEINALATMMIAVVAVSVIGASIIMHRRLASKTR